MTTVVLTLYGDQYDTREERSLLQLFKHVLSEEFANADRKHMGSFMRGNTAITQMLSAYARRPGSLKMLKFVLGDVLEALVSSKESLEINPLKVYFEIINQYETKTGKKSELSRKATVEEAAANPDVIALVRERSKKLEAIATQALDALIENVKHIPYGIRWICKLLGRMGKATFTSASEAQVHSLVGGFLFLRYFNPCIVSPESTHIVKEKPDRVGRRSLSLLSKILQNLSNNMLFKEKEAFMQVFNPFLESNQARMRRLL